MAQAVAAGMMVSESAADSATVVKLFRVARLVPVVLTLALAIGMRTRALSNDAARPPLLPAFLVAFCVLVALSSAGYIPRLAVDAASVASRGIKSSPAELIRMGWAPAVLLLSETLFIGVLVLAGAWLVGV